MILNMETIGLVSSMQHFSVGDGPGIRTTLFMQGCNLRCEWCHNPEAISMKPVLLYYEKLCTHCAECESICPNDAHEVSHTKHIFYRDLCRMCGACPKVCHPNALILSGQKMNASEVMLFLVEDIDFYQMSGGGVTISGGEPLLQPEFTAELAGACKKRGIHVIIDTAGNVDFSAFEQVIPFTDIFFFDLKGLNEKDYSDKTGGSFNKAFENLKRLIKAGCDVTVRLPVIPGYSDTPEYCAAAAEMLKNIGVKYIDLLPFHRLGASKYEALGLEYPYEQCEPPSKEKMSELVEIFTDCGFEAKTDG
jgi:pyruvate formate lyase activating enzyme